MYILNLFRWKNLVLIAFTQLVIWYFVKGAILENHISLALSNFEFILLCLCTVLIAAGGYVINDIFDVEIDKINKQDQLIISKHLSIKNAYLIYYFTLAVATLIALYLGYTQQRIQLLWIPSSICILLFAYAKYFKSGFLFGNIIVSTFVAAVPAIVLLGESNAMLELMDVDSKKVMVIGAYVLFAFMSNLLREIVKDIEDMEGDKAMGCKTLPIVLGTNSARYICVTITLILLITLISCLFFGLNNFPIASNVFIVCITLLLFYILVAIFRAQNKKAFHHISNLIKVAMLVALLGLIFYL